MSNPSREVWLGQKDYFNTGKTLGLDFRMNQLKRLRVSVLRNHQRLLDALKADTGAPNFESDSQIIKFVLQEIEFALKNLKHWVRPVKMGFPYWFVKGEQHFSPVGQILIVGSWRDPLLSTMAPLVSAMAAGNVVTLLPPSETKATSHVLATILEEVFPADYLCVAKYGFRDLEKILEHPFQHIFFAGPARKGQEVLKQAADHFAGTTLFLQGLNPCVVDKSANLDSSVARVALGKFSGGGRSAFAGNYLLLHSEIKAKWLEKFCHKIEQFYGLNPVYSVDYSGYYAKELYESLKSTILARDIFYGGTYDINRQKIAPALIEVENPNDPLLDLDFLGPIFPILTFSSTRELIDLLLLRPNPLALYLFAHDQGMENQLMAEVNFGGGCINETLLQTKCVQLPLNGVGRSGVGQLHGFQGFQAFSHQKSLVRHNTNFDFSHRFPPYVPAPKWFQKTEF